ncbi:MAG: hypothetical protein LUG89_03035 [Methanosphaera sp.]|nr:hypothetical protein [Methanosphaera sp.]
MVKREDHEYTRILNKRIKEFKDIQKKSKDNPDLAYDSIESVNMIVKVTINLNYIDEDIIDGIYLYIEDDGNIADAQYFINKKGVIEVIELDDDEFTLIENVYGDLFAINFQ